MYVVLYVCLKHILLPVWLFVCLFLCVSYCLSTWLSVCVVSTYLPICYLTVCKSACFHVYPRIHLSPCIWVRISPFCLSVHIPSSISISLKVCFLDCLSDYPHSCLSTLCLSSFSLRLSSCLCFSLPSSLSFLLSVPQSIYLPTCLIFSLPSSLSIYPPDCPFPCPVVCLFTYLYVLFSAP